MNFRVHVAYCLRAFAVILTLSTIVSVNGQCTIVEGSENEDPSMNIVAEIQNQNVQSFGQLNRQVQSIQGLLETVITSLQAGNRRSQEHDIDSKRLQSIHKLLNESFNTMRSQHDTVMRSQHDAIIRSLQAVDKRLQEHDLLIKNQIQNSRIIANVWDCSDIKASGQTTSGVYEVCVGHRLNVICANAFCDMETTNGPWMAFQKRINGSVDFFRTWREYEEGFGDRSGEFWLGNEMLHLLTAKRNYKLRIDLQDWEGRRRHAEYARFSISSSADKYRLAVGTYSGDAGDSLTLHSGNQFSTKDVDNDKDADIPSCANYFRGAWWYGNCYHANLNGIYHRGNYSGSATNAEGIQWNSWPGRWYSLKSTEMKLVPVA